MTVADSNVLLDVLGDEPEWLSWSVRALDEALRETGLVINPVVYAEIAPRFDTVMEQDRFLIEASVRLEPFTREMLHTAGVVHRRYRRAGGTRDRILPDFLIGAQAAVSGRAILTRDPRRYSTYFPTVRLITP